MNAFTNALDRYIGRTGNTYENILKKLKQVWLVPYPPLRCAIIWVTENPHRFANRQKPAGQERRMNAGQTEAQVTMQVTHTGRKADNNSDDLTKTKEPTGLKYTWQEDN